MQPYRYLAQVAAVVDFLDDPAEINALMDELEFLYEVADARISGRLSRTPPEPPLLS